mgnify:CR=1 FL=1
MHITGIHLQGEPNPQRRGALMCCGTERTYEQCACGAATQTMSLQEGVANETGTRKRICDPHGRRRSTHFPPFPTFPYPLDRCILCTHWEGSIPFP